MSDQGFTEKQIAKQFNVSQQTISNDLAVFNLPETGKLKTAGNPRGAGRPKGPGRPRGSKNKHTSPPKKHDAHADIVKAAKEGKSKKETADELGVSDRTIRRELEYDAIVEVTC